MATFNTTYQDDPFSLDEQQQNPLQPSYQTSAAGPSAPSPSGQGQDSALASAGANLLQSYQSPDMSPSFNSGPAGIQAPPSQAPPPDSGSGGYAPTPEPNQPTPQALPDYAGMMSQINSATDPVQRETMRDKLARDVFSSLQGSGHDVKWQGSTLMVDGRPYEVGMSQASAPADDGRRYATDAGAAGGGQVGSYAVRGASENTGKFNDTSYSSPKYDLSRAMSTLPPSLASVPTFVQQWNAAHPNQPIQQTAPDRISTWDGDSIDVLTDSDGNAGWWFGSEREYANAHPNGDASGGGMTPLSFDNIQGIDSGAQSVSTRSSTTTPASYDGAWKPGQGPGYTPGDIPMDTPAFDYNSMLASLTTQSDTDRRLQGLTNGILDNPESLDAGTVDSMKAKSKDELSEMQAMDDEELKHSGALMGISDSPWLASERLASRRDRDRSLVASNRDIDIQAATTNAADKRSAAALGLSYTQAQQQSKQAAAALAADTTLRASALSGDRLALRESVKQKAAELGIGEDQVMSSWILGMLDNATKNKSIDVGADIDMRKLAQAGREFQEELAYKLAALQQADAQFGASYGLDLAKFGHQVNEDALGHYLGDLGTGGA